MKVLGKRVVPTVLAVTLAVITAGFSVSTTASGTIAAAARLDDSRVGAGKSGEVALGDVGHDQHFGTGSVVERALGVGEQRSRTIMFDTALLANKA